MKITGARTEPFAAIRKRALARAGAQVAVREVSAPDSAAFLGLAATDLTPPVIEALQTLMTEIEDLRNEVSALKLRLNEAQNLADMDVLTPVLNRRAFLREMKRVVAFAQRYGSPASVAVFDLDGFKTVNDRFGHGAGDQALKAVAKRLKDNVRDSDVVGRLSGDEFAVVLAQADHETALARASALADAVMRTPVELGEWSAPLHISFGVRQIAEDPEIALAEATASMLARKPKTAAA